LLSSFAGCGVARWRWPFPHPEGRSAEELGREARSAVSSTAMTGRRTGSGGQRDQRAAGFNHHAATEDDGTPAWTARKFADLPRSSSRRGLTSWSISGPPPATRADQITDGTGAGGLGGALSWRTLVSLGRVSVLALSMGDFRAWG